jgi:uncharacterized protein (TIGR02598 family)
MKFNLHKRVRLSLRGFSLAEVAIAVAIAALGITTVLGLVPGVLENVRQAGNAVSISRICQQMLGELQSADWGSETPSGTGWANLDKYKDTKRYFDAEGTMIARSDGGVSLTREQSLLVAFVAEYKFDVSGNVLLSGSDKVPGGTIRKDIQRVTLNIAVTPNTNFDFTNNNRRFESRAFTLARQF